MLEQHSIKISVRELVEFVLRSGNLSHTTTHKTRLVDAIEAHATLQKKSPEGYVSEVSLNHIIEQDNIMLTIRGRADGILTSSDGVIVDEIKTTYLPLQDLNADHNLLHWAQVKTYAYFYSIKKKLDSIEARLTYFQMETKKSKIFQKKYFFSELEVFFENIVFRYFEWTKRKISWIELRNFSIKKIAFPFTAIRQGQSELMEKVKEAIDEEVKLFVQAPTGIGKTIGTMFPVIQKIEQGNIDRIFYLTAKNTGHHIPQDTLFQMRKNGLRLKSVVITAKEKICLCASKDVNDCEFTVGYFDRLDGAIRELLDKDCWDRDTIKNCAQKHRLCPYEFSLEMALWADCIICDYNYAFDPRVYLRRFFLDVKENYCLLIDEAHNLVDRARSMFSAEIGKENILNAYKSARHLFPEVVKEISKLNAFFLDLSEEKNENINEKTLHLCLEKISDILRCIDSKLAKNISLPSELMDFYFLLLMFNRVATEFYDENFCVHFDSNKKNETLRLLCLNPSMLLQKTFDKVTASLLFSATLSPSEYYMSLLSGEKHDISLQLNSPFSLKNLGLFTIPNIDTSFNKRCISYNVIADHIATLATSKSGNYLAFFPSYLYMKSVIEIFEDKYFEIEVMQQERNMNDVEREEFLENFLPNNKGNLVGFVVMGGIFAEGIDLVGERISGVAIIGVGLPQICAERNLMRSYFEKKEGKGFAYAYAHPGMNRVMQAAGRVIRTETDIGVILLIGERFSHSLYKTTMPKHWYSHNVFSNQHLAQILKSFWQYPR